MSVASLPRTVWRKVYWSLINPVPRLPAALRLLARDARTTLGRPVHLLDCGAAGGPSQTWQWLREAGLCVVYGIEPDEDLCRSQGPTFFPVVVGDSERSAILNVTRYSECSSLLEPDLDTLSDYPDAAPLFEVVSRVPIQMTTIDKLSLEPIDYLKIDVQGFELPALKGAERTLETIVGIELEAHMRPIYRGEAPLHEIVEWLRQRGFILRKLQPFGPFSGELLEFNAYFSRRGVDGAVLRLWDAVVGV